MKGAPARDTHALPPEHICQAYWKYNKISTKELQEDLDVVDFRRGLTSEQRKKLRPVRHVDASTISAASRALRDDGEAHEGDGGLWGGEEEGRNVVGVEPCTAYEHADFPGLCIYPSLLPPETQLYLLSLLLHRDLANEQHKTNLQQDYHVPYPSSPSQASKPSTKYASFFTRPQNAAADTLQPKSSKGSTTPTPPKPLNTAQYLQKRLRWLTLGDQYDWPTRRYSGVDATRFPSDIAGLVRGLFPDLRAESGVVLLYSPKDYMPVHRDVSEECARGLASFSLGCDGLFVVARDTTVAAGEGEDGGPAAAEAEARNTVVLRVRSGDVVHLSKETRWAWHAMPKVIAGTCPEFLADWPVGSEDVMGLSRDSKVFERWKGYMATKRLNISCRQVWD